VIGTGGGSGSKSQAAAHPSRPDEAVPVETYVTLSSGQRVKMIYKCGVFPIVHNGKTVRLGQLCFHAPISEQHSNGVSHTDDVSHTADINLIDEPSNSTQPTST